MIYSFFLKEIPPDLVCDINQDCANTFIKFLLAKRKWSEVLLLLAGRARGELSPGAGLIKDCNLSDLNICAVIPHLSAWDQRKTQLLGCLIDCGGEIVGGTAVESHLRVSKVGPGAFPLLLETLGNSASFLSPYSFILVLKQW